ncbi:MAG TPA: hypothetical protein PK771_06695, partial [Spirochaetota bacterium]|nr:hypothetical protein [Spirochaetota bacterium]
MIDKDKKLIEIYRSFPDKIRPTRDLWDGIESRISKKKRLNFNLSELFKNIKELLYTGKPILAYSFLFFALFVTGLFLFNNFNSQKNSFSQYSSELKEILSDYDKVCLRIRKLVKAKSEFFDEKTLLTIETNMKLMDETINEIKTALKNEPDNVLAIYSLSDIY